MSAVVSQTAVNTVVQQPSGGTAPSLSMNFNAVLSGAESEKTMQSVYVPELGRNVEFALDNDTKVGDIIKITLNKGSRYDYILFTAVTVSKVAQAPSAVAPTNTEAIDTIKKYKPNLIARFFKTGFLRKFLGMFLTFLLVGRFGDVDIEDMFPIIGICVVLMIIGSFYPMAHIKRYYRKHHIDEAIRNDSGYMNVAIVAYNALPTGKMLAYIKELNPAAEREIQRQLEEKKKK